MHHAICLSLALTGILVPGASAAGTVQAPTVPEASTPVEPSLREECFVIEQLDSDLALDPWQLLGAPLNTRGAERASEAARVVGLLQWRRSETPSAYTLEWDVRFPEDDTRLLVVERVEGPKRTLVFREMQPRSGRTLCADWLDAGATLRLREWSGPQGIQERLTDVGDGRFTLDFLEQLRAGGETPERVRLFDPLSRSFEILTVHSEQGAAGERWEGRRRVVLERADGTQAGAYLLEGSQVLGFQWQSGNLRVRRIESDEYERRLQALLRGPGPEPAAE